MWQKIKDGRVPQAKVMGKARGMELGIALVPVPWSPGLW